MSIKLIKASYEYQDLIVDMLKEWIDYNNNHPEANTSPSSILIIIILIIILIILI